MDNDLITVEFISEKKKKRQRRQEREKRVYQLEHFQRQVIKHPKQADFSDKVPMFQLLRRLNVCVLQVWFDRGANSIYMLFS